MLTAPFLAAAAPTLYLQSKQQECACIELLHTRICSVQAKPQWRRWLEKTAEQNATMPQF
jgi:hypothetical protein